MNAGTPGESYVIDLLSLFDRQGPALFGGANSLCLTVTCLHYIQSQMTAVFGGVGRQLSDSHSVKVALPPNSEGAKNRAVLRLLDEHLGKVIALKIIPDKQVINSQVILNLAPFRSLNVLILKKVHIKFISNIQLLRTQLKTLIVQRCQIEILHELLVTCGTDDATPIVWGSLKELDVSMNALRGLGQCLQYVPFLEKANFSNNCICDSFEGMEAIDKLEFLHLGFNQLKAVPRFAYRTRYHLKVFNLRNNCLERLDGLEELESLCELDLTDNMLCNFSALKPLRALNHLQILALAGNPITYQDYRIKALGYMSSLINKEIFVLDGKKLTSSEQKAIPKEDIIPIVGTPSVPIPQKLQVTTTAAGLEFPPKPSTYPKAKRKQKKKPREILLDDDDDVTNTPEGDGTGLQTSTFVPLDLEGSLQQEEILRKQLQDNWLLSKMGAHLNGASKERKVEPLHEDTVLVRPEDSMQTVDNEGPQVETAPLELGETFMAEVYESDTEDQGGQKPGYPRRSGDDKKVFLNFTERFFMEKDMSAGRQLDKMDLQSLTSAVIEKRVGKRNQQIAVLVLTFNSGRRDRRKREYVLLEDEEHQKAILSILEPIIDENKGISITTKLECLKCSSVFDSSLAQRLPTDDLQHLSSPYSKPKNLACPHCKSLLLVEKTVTPPTARLGGPITSSPKKLSPPKRAQSPPKDHVSVLQEACLPPVVKSQVVNLGASVRVGFEPPNSRPDVLPASEVIASRSLSCPVPSPDFSNPGLIQAQTGVGAEEKKKDIVLSMQITSSSSPSSHGTIQTNQISRSKTSLDSTHSGPVITSADTPTTSGSLSDTQSRQSDATVGGSGLSWAGSRMGLQSSLQPDSSTQSGRAIPQEDFAAQTSQGGVKKGPSPPQPKLAPSLPLSKQTRSPPQSRLTSFSPQSERTHSPPVDRGPVLSQDVTVNSAVAREISQTGKGEGATTVSQLSSSGEQSCPGGMSQSHRRSTNPFDSDEDIVSQDHSSPPPRPGSSLSAKGGASPIASHSRQRYTIGTVSRGRSSPPLQTTPPSSRSASGNKVLSNSLEKSPIVGPRSHSRSKSQDLRNAANIPVSKKSSDPFDEDETPVLVKRASQVALTSQRQPTAVPRSWQTSSDTPVTSHNVTSSPSERPRQSTSDLQQSRYSVASDFVNNTGKRKNKPDRRGSEGTPSQVPNPRSTAVFPVTSHSSHEIIPYKKEDPGYIHHSIHLYLDMEVFNTEQGERFVMIFKSHVSHYNTGQEYDAVFIASNFMAYIFKIIGPFRSEPTRWLRQISKIPLKNLMYIDIDVGYQTLRLEFDLEGQCYTFLMGDEKQCDICATKLSFVVSDVWNSSFRSIEVHSFSIQSIRDPDWFMQQELKKLKSSSISTEEVESGDEQLCLFLHTGHMLPRETVWSRAAFILSTKHLFLAQENYDQWPLSKLQRPPETGHLRPPFSNVRYKEITDVEKLVRHSQRTITIHFFKESVANGDLSDWRLHMYSHLSVNKLITEVSRLWKDEFQTDMEVVAPSDMKDGPPSQTGPA